MQILIESIVGMLLAIGFLLLARRSVSFAKEKQIYAIGLVVVALIYVGFGLFSDSVGWKIIELLGVPIYAFFAWLGLKKSGRFLAIGWALHVFWDAGLHGVSSPFVPHWYIGGCLGFDLLVAAYIGVREVKKLERLRLEQWERTSQDCEACRESHSEAAKKAELFWQMFHHGEYEKFPTHWLCTNSLGRRLPLQHRER